MYYADCMLVFRDDYVMASESAVSHEAFFIGDPTFPSSSVALRSCLFG